VNSGNTAFNSYFSGNFRKEIVRTVGIARPDGAVLYQIDAFNIQVPLAIPARVVPVAISICLASENRQPDSPVIGASRWTKATDKTVGYLALTSLPTYPVTGSGNATGRP
jgi:hypothetical protein